MNISSFHPFAVDLFLDLVYYLLNFVQCIHLLLGVVGVHVGQLLNLPQLLSKHTLRQSRHTVAAILREQYFFQFLLGEVVLLLEVDFVLVENLLE